MKVDSRYQDVNREELQRLSAENERLRGLIKTYRNMLRYDWIAQQDKKIKELSAVIDALRGEGKKT